MTPELPASEVPFTERFRVISRIGEGSMGVVYHLHDTQLQQSVAAKALRAPGPEELYRLKKEFRTLAGLRHPNLVRLHELFVGDDHCFFSMELVAGASFVEHVRAGQGVAEQSPADHEKLRDALGQLASALGFLHGQGKIHRDLKPSNVLVEPTGRVVVLDFGLATDLVSTESVYSRAGVVAGTFAYMSPEQVAGADLGPAADCYAVGVMLFEALTGKLPFQGPGLTSLLDRQQQAPPSPRELEPGVPDDLERLTVDLLCPTPEGRPHAGDIATRISAARTQAVSESVPAGAALGRDAFVGRHEERAVLDAALKRSREGLTLVRLTGASGIGKTALVERFLDDLEPHACAVFRCRCQPRETVPFKGVDGLVDGLARLLTHQDSAEIRSVLPRNSGALLRTFPVLGRVAELAAAADHAPPAAEPQERRRQAFEALRELVARLAETRRVVLWIDDAQWGDADSGVVLRELCRGPDPPRALVLLSSRNDAEPGSGAAEPALLSELDELELPSQALVLGPLGHTELEQLVERALGDAAAPPSGLAAALAKEAAGSPFLALELARSSAELGPDAAASESRVGGLKALMAKRVRKLGAEARDLLEHVAVAGHPVQERVLASALGRPLERRFDLAEQRLIRLLPHRGETAVGTYHESIAEAVLEGLAPERRRELHHHLAESFLGFPGLYDQSVVDHFVAAGDPEAAANSAYALAEGALAASAFHQAVALYGRALDLETDRCPRWLLLAKLAECTVNAGRGAEAAPRFLEAADELALIAPTDVQVAALRRRAAFEFLRSGLYTEGSETLRDAFHHLGIAYPDTTLRAIAWIAGGRARWGVRRLAGLHRRNPAKPATPQQSEALELLWAAGQGHSFLDMTRGAAFQTLHANFAFKLGDPRHLSRAISTEALFVAWEQGARGDKRVAELLLEAEQLASECGDPAVRAHALLMRSVTLLLAARWRHALQLAEEGEQLCLSECRGASWELASFHQNILAALTNLGELQEVGPRIEGALRQAVDRGDRFAMAILPVGPQNLAWLAADDPDEAERRITDAVGPAFEERSYWYLYQAGLARTQIDLYRGEPLAGLERVDRIWKALRAGWMLRMPGVRCVLRDLRMRCALLAAEQADDGAARATLLRRVEKDSKRNRREPMSWFGPYLDRAAGVAASLRGQTEAGAQLLEKSAIGFQHVEMGLLAAGVRYRMGAVAPTPATAASRDAAARWMRGHGVVNPERMAPLC